MKMLVRRISEALPGMDLRKACRRWVSTNKCTLRELADDLGMDALDVQAWLQESDVRFALPASSEALEALEKHNKKQKKKKRGPKETQVDWGRVEAIKEYGVERYCDNLLRRLRRTAGDPASARSFT